MLKEGIYKKSFVLGNLVVSFRVHAVVHRYGGI